MNSTSNKTVQRMRRHARIRSKIKGAADCPRLALFRSNRYLHAQLIDDDAAVTLLGADTRKAKGKTALLRAKELGTMIATEAKKKGVTKIVFDRGGFSYQGAIAAFADGAREGGLIF